MPSAKRQMPIAKCQEAKCLMPNINCSLPSVKYQMPNVKCPTPKVNCQRSKCQMSSGQCQMPNAHCQVSKAKHQIPNAKSQLPYAKGPNDVLIDLGLQFDSKRWPKAPRRPPGGSQEGPKDKTTAKVQNRWYPEVPRNHFLGNFWMFFGVVFVCFFRTSIFYKKNLIF